MSNTSRKLSTDEVSALMEGLQSGEIGVATGINKDLEVSPFTFGSDDLSLLGDYYALRLINERFARAARSIFQPMLRVQPRISSFPPEVKTFEEYTSGLDSFMSLSTFRIDELRGSLLITMQPSFISILTNSFYGGNIETTKEEKTEFTATEDRLIEKITLGLSDTIESAWKDLTPISLRLQGREVNPQFATFVDASDLVIICSFVVQLPNVDAANFDTIYPLQTLKPIASLLRSRLQTDVVEDDLTWREKLERAVLGVPLNLTARLSEPTMSMARLLRVKEGDMVPMQKVENVDVLVEGKEFFKAEIGEISGQAAVNLTERE